MVFKPARAVLAALAGLGLTRNGSALDVTSIPVRKADGSTVYAKWAIVSVVGPASYAAGGFAVDCSAFFSSILSAVPSRQYTTATMVPPTAARLALISETGANTFSAAKFQCMLYAAPSHTHTYDKYNADTSLVGSGTTYTSTASGNPSVQNTLSQVGAVDVSLITYEFLVLGVPV